MRWKQVLPALSVDRMWHMEESDGDPRAHAWDEEETIFTADDDRNAPELEVPDEELTSPAADAGVERLIRAAEEAGDG
jgi:hypothetical protein